MAHTANFTHGGSMLGESFSTVMAITTDLAVAVNTTAPTGFAGTLTTRTDANTGVITTGSAHGLIISDFVDVYWSGGSRTRMDITAVTTTTISVDLGAGTDLPIATTVLTVSLSQSEIFVIPAGGLRALLISGNGVDRTLVTFTDGTLSVTIELSATNGYQYVWAYGSGVTDPLASLAVSTVVYVSTACVATGGSPVKVYALAFS